MRSNRSRVAYIRKAARKMMRSRRYWLTLLVVAALELGFFGFFNLPLNRDEQVSFLGSAFGASVAALAAFGAIEYQFRRQQRATTKIIADIFAQARRAADSYAKTIERTAIDPNEIIERARIELELLVDCLQSGVDMASEVRSTVPGMARVTVMVARYSTSIARVKDELVIPLPTILGTECREAVVRLREIADKTAIYLSR